MTPEFQYAHEGYCNANRVHPVGCGGCSCRAGLEIKRLRALLTLADKAIYAVVDGDIALVCDACAVKYYTERHKEPPATPAPPSPPLYHWGILGSEES